MKLYPNRGRLQFGERGFKERPPGRQLQNRTINGPGSLSDKVLHNLLRRTANKKEAIRKIGDEDLANVGPFLKERLANFLERRRFAEELPVQSKLEPTLSFRKDIVVDFNKVVCGLLKLLEKKSIMKRRAVKVRSGSSGHLSPRFLGRRRRGRTGGRVDGVGW